MRGVWSCSACIALLLSTLLPYRVAAIYRGSKEKISWVDKIHVIVLQYEKRGESSTCTTGYSLCPASLSGGCCPNGYACAKDSCYSTAEPTSTACGRAGYFACGGSFAPGCCPQGYICGLNDCTAPPGVTASQNCPVGYYVCPASYNYGCCQSGYGCGLDLCYATSPMTWVFTYTTTANGAAETVTTTTVTTPTAPSGIPTSDTSAALPKFIPTTVDKIAATSSPSSSGGGGLSSAEIGGIVGGAIGLLAIVLLATFLILRRLNSTVKAVESKGTSSRDIPGDKSSTTVSVAQVLPRFRPTAFEVDRLDYDPLMEDNSTPGSVTHGRSRSATEYSNSQQATPLPTSASGDGIRGPSMESRPENYFDIPRPQNMPGRHANSIAGARSSMDSQSQYNNPPNDRHYSNASELSANSGDGSGAGSPFIVAELDNSGGIIELPGSDTEGESGSQRRRSSSAVAASPRGTSPYLAASPNASRPPLAHQRRRSDSQHARGRSESGATQPLDVVNENAEVIHGYYGPPNVASGQTHVGLNIDQDISSPIGPRFRG